MPNSMTPSCHSRMCSTQPLEEVPTKRRSWKHYYLSISGRKSMWEATLTIFMAEDSILQTETSWSATASTEVTVPTIMRWMRMRAIITSSTTRMEDWGMMLSWRTRKIMRKGKKRWCRKIIRFSITTYLTASKESNISWHTATIWVLPKPCLPGKIMSKMCLFPSQALSTRFYTKTTNAVSPRPKGQARPLTPCSTKDIHWTMTRSWTMYIIIGAWRTQSPSPCAKVSKTGQSSDWRHSSIWRRGVSGCRRKNGRTLMNWYWIPIIPFRNRLSAEQQSPHTTNSRPISVPSFPSAWAN